jgi:hypothetical protein
MTPLLWFLLGGFVFSLLTVLVMALVAVSKAAEEREEEAAERVRVYRRGVRMGRHEANPARYPLDDEIVFTPDPRGEIDFTPTAWIGNGNPHLRVRRGPYNWENES